MADINQQLALTMGKLNADVAKLDKTIEDLTKSLQTLVQGSGNVAKEQQKEHDKQMERNRDLENQAAGEILQKTKKNKLTDEEIKVQSKLVESIKDRKQAEQEILKYQNLINAGSGNQVDLQNKLAGAEEKLFAAEVAHKRALDEVGGGFLSFLKKMNLLGAALTWITGMVVHQYQAQKEAIKLTSGMIDLGDSFTAGRIKLEGLSAVAGLASDTTMKSITANRQAVNAMGGTAKAITSWSGTMESTFTSMTGDVDEGFQLYLESQQMLRQQGVKPTVSAMQGYAIDLKKLGSLTGMQAEQAAALYNEVASDTDSRVLLKAAREGERQAILASQRALINMNIAAGMTAEQAKEAAKMLNKMVAAKPIERMKQAARMRALGAAFGVGGGEQAAAALIAGPRATAQQREQLNDFNKSITTVADQMRGQGLGQEIFSTTLLEKLNLDQYYGADSPFSTTLTSALKSAAGPFVDAMHDKLLKPMIKFQENANRLLGFMQGDIGGIAEGVKKIVSWLPTFSFFGGKTTTTAEQKAEQATNQAMVDSMMGAYVPEMTTATTAALEKPSKTQDTTSKAVEDTAEATKKHLDVAEEHKEFSKQAATGIDNQLKAMGSTNEILQKIHENSEKQVDLAERQLAAATLTESEKKGVRSRLFEGSEYAARYATFV